MPAPTERSIPPIKITSVMPTPTTTTMAARRRPGAIRRTILGRACGALEKAGGVGDDVVLRRAAGQLGDEPAAVEDEDAMGEALHFGQVGRRHEHGHALLAE